MNCQNFQSTKLRDRKKSLYFIKCREQKTDKWNREEKQDLNLQEEELGKGLRSSSLKAREERMSTSEECQCCPGGKGGEDRAEATGSSHQGLLSD